MLENSLKKYNYFLKNSGISNTIQGFAKEQLKIKKKIKILDIACGNGNALSELKDLLDSKIEAIGIDLKEFENKKIDCKIIADFNEADLKEFEGTLDLIFCFRASHLIAKTKNFIEKILRLLSIKGKAILLMRITELKSNKLKFAGNQTTKDIAFLVNLIKKRKLDFNGKKFLIENKKHWLHLKDLSLNAEDLKNFGEKKILYGLALTIERIK